MKVWEKPNVQISKSEREELTEWKYKDINTKQNLNHRSIMLDMRKKAQQN